MTDTFLEPSGVVGPFEGVRAATADDVPFMIGLASAHAEAIAEDRGAELLLRHGMPSLRSAERLAGLVAADDAVVVIGTFDEVPFGYAAARFEPLDDGGLLAVIDDLLVDAEARKLGIGETMMNEVVASAKAAGCLGVDAVALPGDRNTKNFFESFGLKARLLVVHHRF
ncbi:MAG: GNAT family N-acetyltransferase [Acidimicrobiales bacterium]